MTPAMLEPAESETSAENSPSPAAPTLRTDTLASSILVLLAVTVIQRLVGFGRGIVYCRWLEPEALGQWDLAFGFLLLAAPVAVLGLPGSFGRYVEHYRQRGQLRTFLRRTTAWTAVLSLLTVAVIVATPGWFAGQIFGDSQLTTLAMLTALCLAVVIVHHFLESLLMALRMSRVVSGMQFFQSLGFALLSITLLIFWDLGPASIVLGYAGASLLSATGSLIWLRRALVDLPEEQRDAAPPQRQFWVKLLPFAAWIWATSLLANLFGVIDRYMLVHYSGMEATAAMIDVGNYHSSRIVPLLLVGVAGLFGSIIMPYLSHDWEAGRRLGVSLRLNLALKLVALFLMSAGVGLLLFAPLMFDFAFAGKYSGGLAVLPWTLVYCTWFSITVVAQNYLWCCEKTRLCSVAFFIGLLLNVVLNLVLLPRYGLMGAVLGTTAANLLVLLLSYYFNRMAGMQIDTGTWILSLTPVALGLSTTTAAVTLAVLLVLCCVSSRLITADEKRQLLAVGGHYLARLRPVSPTVAP